MSKNRGCNEKERLKYLLLGFFSESNIDFIDVCHISLCINEKQESREF